MATNSNDPICVACSRPLSEHPWGDTEGIDPGCLGCFEPDDIEAAGWTVDTLRDELRRRQEAQG